MGSLAEWYQRIPTPDDLTRVESLFANIQAQFPATQARTQVESAHVH